MPNTKDTSLCRTCLKSDGSVYPLTYTSSNHQDINFAVMLMSCTSICIAPEDPLPQAICEECLTTLILAYDYKQQCEKIDLLLRKRVNHLQMEKAADNEDSDHEIKTDQVHDHKKKPKKRKSTSSVYKCVHCDKQLTTRYGLIYHSKHHAAKKNYACPVEDCKRTFFWKPTLNRHMQTHSQEKPFVCHLCGKEYSAADSLRYHIRNHQGQRPHLCVHCGKTFKQAVHLTYHMNTHTGLRQYVCSKCNRTYMGPTQLNRHWRKYCGIGKDPPERRNRSSQD